MTDLFNAVHVSSVVRPRIEATAPWGLVQTESGAHDAYAYAHFVHVARGSCYLSLPGHDTPQALAGGDCVLLAANTSYTLRDHPDSPAVSFRDIGGTEVGGGGASTTIVNGWFTFDRLSSRSCTDLLPAMIVVRADEGRSRALKATLDALTAELTARGPGTEVIVTRLADMLFIQLLRTQVDSGGCDEKPRWLRALADPHIGKSLEAMHGAVERQWTVATLAAAAGLSRSAFAPRFKTLVGETPLEYLTRWRMQTAGRLLRDGGRKMSAVAAAVGYVTEPAFTRAFRRVHGVSPSEYRRLLPGQNVDRARVVVGDEEPARGVDDDIDRSAPVAVGVGPSDH